MLPQCRSRHLYKQEELNRWYCFQKVPALSTSRYSCPPTQPLSLRVTLKPQQLPHALETQEYKWSRRPSEFTMSVRIMSTQLISRSVLGAL